MDFEDISKRGACRMYPWEIEILYNTAKARRPEVIVEIGSWDGCSTIALGLVAKDCGGKVYAIDPKATVLFSENMKHFGLEDIVVPITGFSPWIKGIPERINYLFIDGDHSTKSVLLDYSYWIHFLKKNDIVAFHDITFDSVKNALDIIFDHDGKHLREIEKCELRRRGIGVWQAY